MWDSLGHPERKRCFRHWYSMRKLAAFIRFRTDTWICRSYSTIFHFLNVFPKHFYVCLFSPRRALKALQNERCLWSNCNCAHQALRPSKPIAVPDKTLHSNLKWNLKGKFDGKLVFQYFEMRLCHFIFGFVVYRLWNPNSMLSLPIDQSAVTMFVVRDLTHVLSCPLLHK